MGFGTAIIWGRMDALNCCHIYRLITAVLKLNSV